MRPISRSLLSRIAGPATLSIAALGLLAAGPGCGDSKATEYKARPAFSGKAANLPPVPTLPQKPKKVGDAYTVWGLIHDLRSQIHSEALLNQEQVTVVGYIVKTNLNEAPPCAVHRSGKKDGPECEKTPPPVPTFWIADEKNASPNDAIQVMGWSSNFAKLYDALQQYKKPNNKEDAKDETWGVSIPNPLPAPDAKVKVVGKYSTSFTLTSTGAASDPLNGIITYKSLEYLEPPPTPGTLPGVK